MTKKYEAEPRALKYVFSEADRLFKVPIFQRNFAWSDEQVLQLWNDIYEVWIDTKESANVDDKKYLFGSLVFIEEPSSSTRTIIDGQQRMATFTILFCLIRDITKHVLYPKTFESGRYPDKWETLNELIKKEYDSESLDRLELNSVDRQFFKERIIKDASPSEKIDDWKAANQRGSGNTFTDSQKKIITAYKILNAKIMECLGTNFKSFSDTDIQIEEWERELKKDVETSMKEAPKDYGFDQNFDPEQPYAHLMPKTDEEKKGEKEKANKKELAVEKYRNIEIQKLKSKWLTKLDTNIKSKLDEKMLDEAKKEDNKDEFKKFWIDIIKNNHVLEVVVNNEDDAFQIFETLNHRGTELTKSDLIKNYLLKQIKIPKDSPLEIERSIMKAKEVLDQQWQTIFENIGSQKDDEFIRESLRSRHFDRHENIPNMKGVVKASKNNLFKIIKYMLDTAPDAKKFVMNYLSDLEDDSKIAKFLNDPGKNPDSSSKEDIIALKAINAQHVRTAIMVAHRTWGVGDDYRKFVKFAVKFFFRYRTICGGHPGNLDTWTMEICEAINSGKGVNNIIQNLKEKIDNHRETTEEEFLDKFENFDSKSDSTCRYILEELERAYGGNTSDLRPVDDITLEHILPKKYDKEWDKDGFFDGYTGSLTHRHKKDMEIFVHKIGNMTLLKGIDNSALQNKDFPTKKNHLVNGYTKSDLNITKQTVVNNDKWTATIIEQRQKEFREKAKEVWAL